MGCRAATAPEYGWREEPDARASERMRACLNELGKSGSSDEARESSWGLTSRDRGFRRQGHQHRQ